MQITMPGAMDIDRVEFGSNRSMPPASGRREPAARVGSRSISMASGTTRLARRIWLFEGKKRARQRPAGLFVNLREEGRRIGRGRYAASGLENFSTVALTRALIGAIASLVTLTPISDSLEPSATSESKVDLA